MFRNNRLTNIMKSVVQPELEGGEKIDQEGERKMRRSDDKFANKVSSPELSLISISPSKQQSGIKSFSDSPDKLFQNTAQKSGGESSGLPAQGPDESRLGLINNEGEEEIDMEYVKYKFRQEIDDSHEIRIIPVKDIGGSAHRAVKQFVKLVIVIALFVFV